MASNRRTQTHAFNLSLVAFDLELPDRPQNQIIGIDDTTSTFAGVRMAANEWSPRSLGVSAAEEDRECEIKGLWVGIWFRDAENYTQKAQNEKKSSSKQSTQGKRRKRGNKGKEVLAKGDSVNIAASKQGLTVLRAQEHNVLRVVVILGAKNATYYALVPNADADPESLCTACKVVIDEVFFFPEYRDDNLTAIADRKEAWSQKVRSARDVVARGVVSPSAASKPITDPKPFLKRPIFGEIRERLALYHQTGEHEYLGSVNAIFKRVQEGVQEGGHPQEIERTSALQLLAGGRPALSTQEAEQALEELLVIAPKLREKPHVYDARALQEVSAAIHAAGLSIRLSSLRTFVVLFCEGLEAPLQEESSATRANRVHQLLTLLTDYPHVTEVPKTSFASHGTAKVIIESEREFLSSLLQASENETQALRNCLPSDSMLVSDNIETLIGMARHRIDLDSMELLLKNIHWAHIKGIARCKEKIEGFITERVGQLTKLLDEL